MIGVTETISPSRGGFPVVEVVYDGLSVLLILFIIALSVVAVLIFRDRFPNATSNRIITISDQSGLEWKITVSLTTDTVFAVDQLITVEATLESDTDEIRIENPVLTFPNAYTDDEEARIELSRDQESGDWHATSEIIYYNPGEPDVQYQLAPGGITGPGKGKIGEIAPEEALADYRNNQYVLLFAVVTAIFAAGSLLVALQTA